MYSAVFFGWPTTSIRPSRSTSTPTCSIDVARTTSNGRTGRSGTFSPAFRRAAQSRRAAVESNPASNETPIWSSVPVMSADETREVSSARCSCPTVPNRRGSRDHGCPFASAVCTSSPMYRAMPASSRVALKYPTSVRYGSATSPDRSSSSCPAAISTSATRISAVVSRTPEVLIPTYRRPGYSREIGCSVEKNVFPTSRTCGGKIVVSRPYRARTCSAAFRAVAVDATRRGRTGRSDGVRHEHRASTATSNSPTVVPSAPVIRCSSSWMIRSGGRSRVTGRR